MEPKPLNDDLRRQYLTKLSLISLFGLGFALFVLWAWGMQPPAASGILNFRPSWFDLAILGLATFRLGRLVAFERVFEPLRRPFTVTQPDHTGAGESVEPRGTGVRNALGQLVSCPICAGTWVAAGLTYALYAFPDPTRVFLVMTSAIAIGEILHGLNEALCWSAQLNRSHTGDLERKWKAAQSAAQSRPMTPTRPVAVECEEEPQPTGARPPLSPPIERKVRVRNGGRSVAG